jgi:hypothetical protein
MDCFLFSSPLLMETHLSEKLQMVKNGVRNYSVTIMTVETERIKFFSRNLVCLKEKFWVQMCLRQLMYFWVRKYHLISEKIKVSKMEFLSETMLLKKGQTNCFASHADFLIMQA